MDDPTEFICAIELDILRVEHQLAHSESRYIGVGESELATELQLLERRLRHIHETAAVFARPA